MNPRVYVPADWQPFSITDTELFPEAIENMLRPKDAVKLGSLPKLTQITGGFRPREFSILCGATGVGKTTFLSNLSASLLEENVPHFVASVETGAHDFMSRVSSVFMNQDLNTGDPIRLETAKSLHAVHGNKIRGNLHLSLYENRFSVETLMADIAWHVDKFGVKVAMIDNLNFFMEVTKAADQIVEMDRVIHELIIFCKQIDVHVIMVMHPKKTDHGRVESEFDIKGSSTAVQEAHNVFLLNRPGEDLIKNKAASLGDRELKIAKMRRRGKNVGARLVFRSETGVSYFEGEVF